MKRLAAEVDYQGANSGMLRARATSPTGAWAGFRISCGTDYCSIRSLANNKLVSAEVDYAGSGSAPWCTTPPRTRSDP
ncbi:hypothetical protein GCM10020216_035310 [Nonomuraea helvata]